MKKQTKKNKNNTARNANGQQHEDTTENTVETKAQFFKHHSYIADLSFETFNTSKHLFAGASNMGVFYGFDVDGQQVGDSLFVVALKLKVKVEIAPEDMVMLLELRYEGLFELNPEVKNEETIRRILLVDAVEMLFPYAVMVIANTTRESGFNPVVLEKLDFAKIFAERHDNAVVN